MQVVDHEEEKALNACRAIAFFLSTHNANDPSSLRSRSLLQKDLCWRIRNLNPLEKAIVMAESWYSLLPDDIKGHFTRDVLGLGEFKALATSRRAYVDIAIVTVLEVELNAVLCALDCGHPETEHKRSGEFRYWFGTIKRYQNRPLSVVVTMVGEPRNVPCAICVEHVLNDFDVGLLMLVGIAAGPREKVKLGDAVAAERIYDYEHVRLELRKFFGIPTLLKKSLPRPQFTDVKKNIKVALEIYDEHRMQAYFRELLQKVDRNKLLHLSSEFTPRLHKGTIAAGEKLFADGSLSRMYKRADQRIRAGDQEDSGFVQVAELKNIEWCVFRGICDYGDPTKGDNWHFAAALSAAAAGITFLKSSWRENSL